MGLSDEMTEMSDETKKYGDKHLPHHLFEAKLWVELLQVANLRGEQIAALEAQLAEARRREELLRAVAEAAEWSYYDSCSLCYSEKMWGEHDANCLYQAAIDGGAIEV